MKIISFVKSQITSGENLFVLSHCHLQSVEWSILKEGQRLKYCNSGYLQY